MSKKNIKLVCFDVDGVLLKVTKGGFKEFAEFLGKVNEVKEIHKEYEKRKLNGPWGLEELAKLYGGYKEKYLKQIALGYVETHLMPGVENLIDKLRKNKTKIIAISSNPHFILDVLSQKLKLDFCKGNELEYIDGVATGKILNLVNRNVKAQILQEKIIEYQVEKEEVVIVGKSITDLPMAQHAGMFIAFNPSDNIIKQADHWVTSDDLMAIYGFLI